MFFSFYYVEKIATAFVYNSNLFNEINSESTVFNEEPINAIIENDTIVPGLDGQKVNLLDSYYHMKSFNAFNSYYLVFDKIHPSVSLKDNKDKIIKSGNPLKNEVTFIILNKNIQNYFEQNNIKGDILITDEAFNKNSKLEQLNNDENNFKKLNKRLQENKMNTKICFVNNNIQKYCEKEKMYLVSSNINLNQDNYLKIKKNLTSGSIIVIQDNASIENINLLIKEINFKGMKIVYLSELIKEEK